MDIKKVIDGFLQSDTSLTGSDETKKQVVCELLLNEFKDITAEELSTYLDGIHIHKKERRVEITLSFPWEVERPDENQRAAAHEVGTHRQQLVGVSDQDIEVMRSITEGPSVPFADLPKRDNSPECSM